MPLGGDPVQVDLFASQPHYAEHMWPVWQALDENIVGRSWAGGSSRWWGERMGQTRKPGAGTVTLVAGQHDVDTFRGRGNVILIEHGAGQTYGGMAREGRHYVDAELANHVLGNVVPGPRSERLRRAANPVHLPIIAAGCPRLDRHFAARDAGHRPEPRTMAISFRWNCRLGPEHRSAVRHYERALPRLVARWQAEGWTVLAHGHPRARNLLEAVWRDCKLIPVWDVDEVIARSCLLVCDNSSLMYEFAALDRAVLALNAPWYRRDVEHGLRFWSLVPGHQVDGPEQLAELDLVDYVDRDPSAALRSAATAEVYAFTDDHAARRAAEWIARLIGA